MLSPIQKITGIIPFIFVILTITTPFITQFVWIRRKYTLLFTVASLYCLVSLYIFRFDASEFGFKTSTFPFVYFSYCLIFEKVFNRIKPETMNRNFPVYVVFMDWQEAWVKKMKIMPEPIDRIVSTWTSVLTVFTTLAMMYIF
jgi:hypothetical protein